MRVPPRLIYFAIFLMAGAALLYELLLAAVLSYLLGATILYFSLTIGLFLFALGVGSWLSQKLEAKLVEKFLTIEVILGLLGGLAVPLVFTLYAALFSYLGHHIFNNLFSFLFQAGLAEILFNGFAFALIFAIGLLVGLELPTFTRLVNKSLVLRQALARVFFWDYAGSLAGSVLFPLILLPTLGFLRTGFLIGLLNLGAAVVLASAMAGRLSVSAFSRLGRKLLVAGALLLMAGFAVSARLENFYTRKIFAGNEILWNQTSPYQNILLVKNREGRTSLFLNGELQFQEGLRERRYHETFAHPALSFINLMRFNLIRVLVLGGGDGLLLREIWKYPMVESVTMVDIDEAMTSLAQTHSTLRAINKDSMSDPRLTLIHDDAFRWLLRRSAQELRFDVIFADLPDPVDDALARLYSREFYLMLKRNLAPGGMAVIQAGSLPSRLHNAVKETLKSSGYRVLSLHPAGENPSLGIPGLFESSFVAASPDMPTVDAFFRALPADLVAPYLAGPSDRASLMNSIFRPVLSFGAGSSLTTRLIAVQTLSRNPISIFRARPDALRHQIQNLITRGSLFN